MRILATCFEPFGGDGLNSSYEVVSRLEAPDGAVLGKDTLPVSYERALDVLRTAVEAADPDVVVAFGQAARRPRVTVERVALNLDDAEEEDNLGVLGGARPIVPDGPAAYWSGLPVDELVAALRAELVPAAASRDAGGYLCNHVFYGLMHLIATERPRVRGGFVHLPLVTEQAVADDRPSLALETLVRGAQAILRVVATG